MSGFSGLSTKIAYTWDLTQTNSQGWDAAISVGFKLGGVSVLTRTATYTKISDPSGNDALFFGNASDAANYTNNDFHYFRDKDGTYRVQLHTASGWYPTTDNSLPLGGASNRWTTVYAATGTINTSDAGDKKVGQKEIDESAMYEAVLSVPLKLFQWKDAIAQKGAKKARYHFGPTAQAVRDAFLAHGIDPARLAMFCSDPVFKNEFFDVVEDGVVVNQGVRAVDTGGVRLGLRLDQFFAMRAEAIYRLMKSKG